MPKITKSLESEKTFPQITQNRNFSFTYRIVNLFLTFDRFIYICYHNYYNKMFTKRLTLLYCGITWVIGLAINLPMVFGWADYFYDPKSLNCIWNRLASQSYSIFFPMSSIVIPCCLILFFYIRIFVFANKNKLKVSATHSKVKDLSKSLKIAKGLFGSFMLFTLCWLVNFIYFANKYQFFHFHFIDFVSHFSPTV